MKQLFLISIIIAQYMYVSPARHLTAASSKWPQLWFGLNWQDASVVSFPTHCVSSTLIGPVPGPKNAFVKATAPIDTSCQ